MTTLQIRIDPKTKKAAAKVFKNLGIDMSSGIKLYLAQVARDEAIPFTPDSVASYRNKTEIIKAFNRAQKGYPSRA